MDKEFMLYLFSKNFRSGFHINQHYQYVEAAFANCLNDVQYHYPGKSAVEVLRMIRFGNGWLNTFLYRLGNTIFNTDAAHPLLAEVHWLLKEICASEIYFSVSIGTGLYIRHGEGTVIGSRCSIGKGFIIHQHCTIGHKAKLGNGPTIGDNVEMGVGSSVLGECVIGNNVIIGAHSLVLHSIPDDSRVTGLPGKVIQ